MVRKTVSLMLLLFLAQYANGTPGNTKIKTFSAAKKEVYRIFSELDGTTLYCGCRFRNRKIDPQSCGYVPKNPMTKKGKVNPRTKTTEIEHIVAAHSFGQSFPEWREPEKMPQCRRGKKVSRGRKCAATNAEFARMEADMYNLWPAIGEINGLRSNFRMAEIPGEKREFGQCDVEIADRKVEPREEVRGIIARAYLYMDQTYPGRAVLQKKGGTRKMLEAWNLKYPPSEFEKKWANKVQKIQGNCQPFILPCQNKKSANAI